MWSTPGRLWYYNFAIVLFTEERCKNSKNILPIFQELESQYENIIFFKLSMEEFPDMAIRYNTKDRPSFISLMNGNPSKRIEYKYMSHEEMVNTLKNLLHSFNKTCNEQLEFMKLNREGITTHSEAEIERFNNEADLRVKEARLKNHV